MIRCVCGRGYGLNRPPGGLSEKDTIISKLVYMEEAPKPVLFPIPKPPPASCRCGKFVGQVLPASAVGQNPENAFENFAVVRRWPPAAPGFASSRRQGTDLLPLGVGQK